MNIIINPILSNEVESVLKLVKDSFDTVGENLYKSDKLLRFISRCNPAPGKL